MPSNSVSVDMMGGNFRGNASWLSEYPRVVDGEPEYAPLVRSVISDLRRGTDDGSGQVFSDTGGISDEDVAFANRAGVMEGTGFEGMPAVQASNADYTRSLLMTRKSPTLGLGFDPHRHENVTNLSAGAGARGGVLQGQYEAGPDTIRTNAATRYGGFNPTVMAHESGHRGLKVLSEALRDYRPMNAREAEAIDDLQFVTASPQREEAIIRLLHHRVSGSTPTQWERENFPEIGGKHVKSLIDSIELLAAKAEAMRRPGGPR